MVKRIILGVLVVLFLVGVQGVGAADDQGTLAIVGAPADSVTGYYNSETGVFKADVTEFAGALIQVDFESVQMVGKQMEWRTKDDYLLFSHSAQLHKEDFELKGDVLEYYSEEKRLVATGNVVVVTKDATVEADHLVYEEEKDEALFTGNVHVVFTDGTLEGEKFLMLVEKGELQFFGAFQGQFETDSN